MNILEFKRRLLGHVLREGDGGSDGGSTGGWGSASYGNSIAGMNFSGGVATGNYGSPSSESPAPEAPAPIESGGYGDPANVGGWSAGPYGGYTTGADGQYSSPNESPATAESSPSITPSVATAEDTANTVDQQSALADRAAERKGIIAQALNVNEQGADGMQSRQFAPEATITKDSLEAIKNAIQYGTPEQKAAYVGISNDIGKSITDNVMQANRESAPGFVGPSTKSDPNSPANVAAAFNGESGSTGLAGLTGTPVNAFGMQYKGSENDGKVSNPVSYGEAKTMQTLGLGGQDVRGYEGQTNDQAAGITDNVAPAVAAMTRAITTITPLGNAMNAAKAAQAIADGASVADVAKNFLGGIAAGKLNSAIMGALGPTGQAIGKYNQVASLVNMAAPGSLPGINIGGGIINSALGGGTGQSTLQGGSTTPEGAGIDVGGWSHGSSSVATKPEVLPDTPSAAIGGDVNGSMGLKNTSWFQHLQNH